MLSTIRMLLQRGPAARSSSMLLQRVRHDVSGMLSIRLQLARAKRNLALHDVSGMLSSIRMLLQRGPHNSALQRPVYFQQKRDARNAALSQAYELFMDYVRSNYVIANEPQN